MQKLLSPLNAKLAEFRGQPLQLFFIFAAGLGLLLRAVYAFTSNPLDFLKYCDSFRHFNNATHLFGWLYSFIDQIGYQLWLGAMLYLFDRSRNSVSIFTGLLSMATPCIWWLWLKECIPSRTAQLAGFAAISLLLPWITIYAFFMTETLLLPSLGLALWLTWRAGRLQSFASLLLAALLWDWVINIKITVLPEEIVATVWLFISLWRSQHRRSFILKTCMVSALLFAAFLVAPGLNYYRFGTAWLYPPGGIYSYLNRVFLLSGVQEVALAITTNRNEHLETGVFDSYSFSRPDDSLPFVKWPLRRSGSVSVFVDGHWGLNFFGPDLSRYLRKRPGFDWQGRWFLPENAVIFFCGNENPDCLGLDLLQRLQINFRWLWAPIFLLTLALALLKRNANVLVIMSIFTALCFCLQDWGAVSSGRYRKPWEGVAIVALISLLASQKASSKELIDEPDKGNNT